MYGSSQPYLGDAQKAVVARDIEVAEARAQLDQLRSDIVRLELTNASVEKRKEELEAYRVKLNKELNEAKLNEELNVSASERRSLQAAVEDLRDRLETEKLGHLGAQDEQRQSFALEKGVAARRYQVALAELSSLHEAALRKLKKRCKLAEVRAAHASAEVTEARLKCHELELLASRLPDVTGGRDAGGGGGGGGGQSTFQLGGLAGEIAALRVRQQDYLRSVVATPAK
ncbi:hypothetical protein FOA52_012038 [Chlamydomonas sp. UWO 241]|nr:hypothetical protein FOA52_012038 [Chlamydomonas sp. UWO 241]